MVNNIKKKRKVFLFSFFIIDSKVDSGPAIERKKMFIFLFVDFYLFICCAPEKQRQTG
jgi:hypothetical protein